MLGWMLPFIFYYAVFRVEVREEAKQQPSIKEPKPTMDWLCRGLYWIMRLVIKPQTEDDGLDWFRKAFGDTPKYQRCWWQRILHLLTEPLNPDYKEDDAMNQKSGEYNYHGTNYLASEDPPFDGDTTAVNAARTGLGLFVLAGIIIALLVKHLLKG